MGYESKTNPTSKAIIWTKHQTNGEITNGTSGKGKVHMHVSARLVYYDNEYISKD